MNVRIGYPALKIEWCKALARATRWEEEIRLLIEEMRRILAYAFWQIGWWKRKAALDREDARFDIAAELREGLNAYASAQESKELRWLSTIRTRWEPLLGRAKNALMGHVPDEVVEFQIQDGEDEVQEEEMEW